MDIQPSHDACIQAKRIHLYGTVQLHGRPVHGRGVTEGFGLMFYNARMYDPALGRFTSADTIIPGGVQGYDRYAYVNNSPVNFTDPSGHIACEGACQGDGRWRCKYPNKRRLRRSWTTKLWGVSVPSKKSDDKRKDDPSDGSGGGGCGQQGVYSPSCPGWHFYSNIDNPNLVCPADLNCTAAQMHRLSLSICISCQNPNSPVSDNAKNLV